MLPFTRSIQRNPIRVRHLLVISVMFLIAATSASAQSAPAAPDSTPRFLPLKVVDLSYVDSTANACTDFFAYANGGWLKRDTIPAAYSSSGVSRDMDERNQAVVRSVLDDARARASSLPIGDPVRKLGTFYGSCMDSTAIESAGLTPIRPLLAAAAAVSTRPVLLKEIATLQTRGVGVLFRYSPDVDAHDAAHYMAWLSQGGLGLPDRDYYTRTGPGPDSTRKAYVDHVTRMLVLAGAAESAARADAGRVMALETELAKASLTRLARRDPAATDHPMPFADLVRLSPRLAWPAYFRTVGVHNPLGTVNVAEPVFFARIDTLVATTPMPTWRAYLRYHILARAAPWLSSPFVKEDFTFSSHFSGNTELLPRWKRCLSVTDRQLGEALGQAYIEKTFSPEARRRAKAVIDDIRNAFGERIRQLTWMSDITKARALGKLEHVHEKVGYPDRWLDYSKLDVRPGPFALNVQRAGSFEWQRTVNRPGAAVDTTEWGITVPTVNAYYDGSRNEMVFPAGALAPQTFDANADDGANYGALGGSWAGHELTHGFDDEGRHYDAQGNLRDWWAPADSVHFSRQAALMARQFDGYIQVDTFHVNGALTNGENIADYGGVLTAYDALERALERDGRPGLIDGYTPEQRFFLGYAQTWRDHTRDASLRTGVTVDEHAPARWRANGPLSNSEAFARAFGCKPGDPMVRPRDLVPDIW